MNHPPNQVQVPYLHNARVVSFASKEVLPPERVRARPGRLAMSSPSCSSPFTLRSWLAAGPYTLVMSSSFFGSPYHAGLLAALLEAGLPPSEVAGSSSGALVASLHAAGLSMDEYLGVLRRLAQSGVLRLARPWEEPGGLFSLRRDDLLRQSRGRAFLHPHLPVSM